MPVISEPHMYFWGKTIYIKCYNVTEICGKFIQSQCFLNMVIDGFSPSVLQT